MRCCIHIYFLFCLFSTNNNRQRLLSLLTFTKIAVKVDPNMFFPSHRYIPSCSCFTCLILSVLLTTETSPFDNVLPGLIHLIFAAGYESTGHCKLTAFPL